MSVKILVADDSVTMRKILEMTFAGEDAEVVTVGTGRDAVERAQDLRPDVVLADISMDGMDGYGVAQAIKAQGALAQTAVVVMASQHHPYDAERGRGAGVDDHVSKPFDSQALLDKIGQVLSRPRAAPTAAAAQPAHVAPTPMAAPAVAAAPAMAAPTAAARPAPAAPRQMAASPKSTVMGIGIGDVTPGSPRPVAAGPAPAPRAAVAPAAVAPPPAVVAPAAVAPAAAAATANPRTPAAAPSRQVADSAQTIGEGAASARVASATGDGSRLAQRLGDLGLSSEQVTGVLSLSREVIEQVVWEVVPDLAETIIREEIRRLTAD